MIPRTLVPVEQKRSNTKSDVCVQWRSMCLLMMPVRKPGRLSDVLSLNSVRKLVPRRILQDDQWLSRRNTERVFCASFCCDTR